MATTVRSMAFNADYLQGYKLGYKLGTQKIQLPPAGQEIPISSDFRRGVEAGFLNGEAFLAQRQNNEGTGRGDTFLVVSAELKIA